MVETFNIKLKDICMTLKPKFKHLATRNLNSNIYFLTKSFFLLFLFVREESTHVNSFSIYVSLY